MAKLICSQVFSISLKLFSSRLFSTFSGSLRSPMAVIKNKRLMKGGKKRAKKKVVDPVSKKDWYDMKASVTFNIRNTGKNLVTRTQGTKITYDGLKDCVFEMSLTNLQNAEVAFRKFKLIIENVQGKNCLTNFHGMDLIRNIFHGQKVADHN
ncbi:small ribosomal subunit protein eS1-like [Dama dama]